MNTDLTRVNPYKSVANLLEETLDVRRLTNDGDG